VVALLSSAFAFPFGLSQPLLGPIGDALGKARVIKMATAILAVCLLASALAPTLAVLFISRILAGVAAGGIMPVCMALIGDKFALAVRQVAMSRYIGATLVGQLAGVSVGGVLASGSAGAGSWAVPRVSLSWPPGPPPRCCRLPKSHSPSEPTMPWRVIGSFSTIRVLSSASPWSSLRGWRSTASCRSSAI
jgi:MFS family permease